MKHVVIIGAGFAGLKAAKRLGKAHDILVTLIDRKNYHLFQPLLYQVAMAGLSPAEIAVPIRHILAKYKNVRVIQEEIHAIDLKEKVVRTSFGPLPYDSLMLACGSQHSYFSHEEWEKWAPGLKTLEQATEIRRRVLNAFEEAEKRQDPEEKKRYLTFVVVGGGPTGVELAGAIGEMSRYTLAKDFRNIDPRLTRIILVEAGPRILPTFSEEKVSEVVRDLESLGIQVWTASAVTGIDEEGVTVGAERLRTATVLWAAGVEPSTIGRELGLDLDPKGRVYVEPDLSLKRHPEVFVAGDLAHCKGPDGKPLPGLAPVALQQGKWIADNIIREIQGKAREDFVYHEKGQMVTMGRSKAIAEIWGFKFTGFFAWLVWLFVHIYYLIGFKNRLFVFLQWISAYCKFGRGARLIVNKEWRFYNSKPTDKPR